MQRDGQRDFDFLMGTWNVHNRRLDRPLSGSESWYEFGGILRASPVWGGNANLDEVDFDSPLGRIEGLTLRLYDEKTREWKLYWGTRSRGLIPLPNVGAFDEHGVGEFFCREDFEGRPIVCRYRWGDVTPESCRWEQAFSVDDGATWEVNWTMQFTRRADAA
jgi:hypothetical protein